MNLFFFVTWLQTVRKFLSHVFVAAENSKNTFSSLNYSNELLLLVPTAKGTT
jgi:hypothetical protein